MCINFRELKKNANFTEIYTSIHRFTGLYDNDCCALHIFSGYFINVNYTKIYTAL